MFEGRMTVVVIKILDWRVYSTAGTVQFSWGTSRLYIIDRSSLFPRHSQINCAGITVVGGMTHSDNRTVEFSGQSLLR
jgi:hypothetical protein